MSGLVSRLLAHPLTRGLPVDDPSTTVLRRRIVREKPFLNAIYREWYSRLLSLMPTPGTVLEIGSGAGFLKELRPDVITSEVFCTPGVDVVADGRCLPFLSGSLDGVVMTDVFHHIPDVAAFLGEAARCVRPGGRMALIEPWRTRWSEWIFRNFHPEPFDPDADWSIPATGPLSGANGALPWIVFERDRARFLGQFPEWRVSRLEPMMPFSYLFSGGVSLRSLAPGWSYSLCRALESVLGERRLAMFALIVLERRQPG
jgi:SAM-dependent methyltransferase